MLHGEFRCAAPDVQSARHTPWRVIATALDVSMGHLLHRHYGTGATLEMKVQYFAAIRTGTLRCEASFLKRGRKIFFLQAKAIQGDNEVAALATSTWKLL